MLRPGFDLAAESLATLVVEVQLLLFRRELAAFLRDCYFGDPR